MIFDQVLSGLNFSFLEHPGNRSRNPLQHSRFQTFPFVNESKPVPLCPNVLVWVHTNIRKAQLNIRVPSCPWSPFPALTCNVCLGKEWTKVSTARSFLLPAISDTTISHAEGCIQTSTFNLSSMDVSTVYPYLPQTFLQWVHIALKMVAFPYPSSSWTTFPVLKQWHQRWDKQNCA